MFKKKPLRINVYWGYGTPTRFRATGRALEDEQVSFEGNTGVWKTLWNIFKQFESDEIKKAKVHLKLSNGQSFETQTDAEGYYHFDKKVELIDLPVDKKGWVSYTVSYPKGTLPKISNRNIFPGKMLIPNRKAEYGVISDIDDTILHTGVASFFKWRLIVNTFFKNFDRRLPLEGTIDFYKKLQSGTIKLPVNPIFYVSNSPWNLYDYLTAFLKRHHFPEGPILLRDFRTFLDRTPKPTKPHKEAEIENILETYPNLSFILIGDSGEKDADYYIDIAQKYPNRILAIYLRSVNHKKREKRVADLIKSFTDTPTLLVRNSKEAETHARELGLIL